MKLNPSKTGKGAKLWNRYVIEEAKAERMMGLSSFSSGDISAAWRKAHATYTAWCKAEGIEVNDDDE